MLKENLEKGYSLCKSKYETVKALGGEYDESLISSPNNILGLEYTKALLKLNSAIEIFPLKREVNHAEEKLRKGISSAGSIRKAIRAGKKRATKVALPKFVYKDLKGFPEELEKTTLAAAIIKDAEEIAEVPDCTEGLENRIKALLKDNKTLPELLNKVTTRRYTESRIRRILTCNLLGITRPLVVTALNKPLYAKVLATNKSGLELIAEIEKNGNVPLLTRKSDLSKLGKSALAVYDIDVIANELYSLSTDEKINENQMIIAER
ncbi:MAG: nucleotidyltransferase family protein [Clostridia bacterium]|nr:nucleotidyltransferase family protein [Clostridia bacterium]